MKRILKVILSSILLLMVLVNTISADSYKPGYSEWSDKPSGNTGEVKQIQYGKKLPKTWSPWSTTVPSSKYQKNRVGKTNHYTYNGEACTWQDANAKELFTWNFGSKSRVTYLYVDVDTYVGSNWTNYQGPPLQVYCDGTLIKSVGTHDPMKNWNPSIDCNCQYLKLAMSANNSDGRNRTTIVGSWATTTATEYSYVTEWDNGSGWRFNTPYEELFGENSQIPTQRNVYSYPLTYSINYELSGGEPLGTLIKKYTILDEVPLPSVYRKGYTFIGWYDKNGKKYEKIPKGTYGDITLIAKYDRKDPTIYIGTASFDEDDRTINISELISGANGKASDELDGDISSKIKVDYIVYTKTGERINNPTGLDLNEGQKVIAGYSVTNSGGKTVSMERTIYILGKYQVDEFIEDDTRIYTRFISDRYKNTIEDNSVWINSDYQELLNNVYEKMGKGD